MLSTYLSKFLNTSLPIDNKIWNRNTPPFVNENIKISSLKNATNSLILDETGNLFVRVNGRYYIVDNFYSNLINYNKSFINVFNNINVLSIINVPDGCKILNIILFKGLNQKNINIIVDGIYSYFIDKNGNISLYRNGNIIYSFGNEKQLSIKNNLIHKKINIENNLNESIEKDKFFPLKSGFRCEYTFSTSSSPPYTLSGGTAKIGNIYACISGSGVAVSNTNNTINGAPFTGTSGPEVIKVSDNASFTNIGSGGFGNIIGGNATTSGATGGTGIIASNSTITNSGSGFGRIYGGYATTSGATGGTGIIASNSSITNSGSSNGFMYIYGGYATTSGATGGTGIIASNSKITNSGSSGGTGYIYGGSATTNNATGGTGIIASNSTITNSGSNGGNGVISGGDATTSSASGIGIIATNGSIINNETNGYIYGYNSTTLVYAGTAIEAYDSTITTLGTVSGTIAFNLQGGNTLTLDSSSTLNKGNTECYNDNTIIYIQNYNSNLVLNSGITTINNNNSNITISNVISGSGNITFDGTGTTTLSGTNTYTGSTTLDQGTTLSISSYSNIETGSIIFNSGTLETSQSSIKNNIIIENPSILNNSNQITLNNMEFNYPGLLNANSIILSGSLTIDPLNYDIGVKYKIISSTNLSGKFSSIYANGYDINVIYENNDVYIILYVNLIVKYIY